MLSSSRIFISSCAWGYLSPLSPSPLGLLWVPIHLISTPLSYLYRVCHLGLDLSIAK